MKTRKILSALLSAAMILTAASAQAVFAAEGDACAENGCGGVYNAKGFCTAASAHYEPAEQVSDTHHSELSGTHGGYYAIENAGQLYWFAKKVDGGEKQINAVLVNDIIDNEGVLNTDGSLNTKKASGFRAYNPIGSTEMTFEGIFDGNGKTVSGLYCDNGDNETGTGLFGGAHWVKSTYPGTIKNVTVKDAYFCGGKFVGGIVGYHRGGKSSYGVENCHSYATVRGASNVGGIVGDEGNSLMIKNCTNHGYVYGSNQTGGIIGSAAYVLNAENCANFGDVSWIEGGHGTLGGFAGLIAGSTSYNALASIKNCFNAGNVTYDGASDISTIFVGGFVGQIYNANVTSCYSTGTVKTNTNAENENYLAGGFAGKYSNQSTTTFSKCYYNKDNITKGGEAVTDGTGNEATLTDTQLLGVTTADMKSGRVAYLLGNAFKQTLNSDDYPTFSGLQVYYSKDFDKYYNPCYGIFGVNTDGQAVITVPERGKYKVVFADYENGALNNVKVSDVTVYLINRESKVDIPADVSLGKGDKIMLWNGFESFKPLCNAYLIQE